jgi:hypothetical protein
MPQAAFDFKGRPALEELALCGGYLVKSRKQRCQPFHHTLNKKLAYF